MVRHISRMFATLMMLTATVAVAAEEVQWVRVTALLEPAPGAAIRAEQTLIPGGVYSLDEVDRRGLEAIDKEILDRTEFLGEQVLDVERAMRLATLLARQYYLPLEVGRNAVLPVIDLNPRLGIVFTPQQFLDGRVICKVQFLEPQGPSGSADFTGEPITLRLEDADLQRVLKVFSQIIPFNIEIDPSVSGRVTVDLRDVPWDQALDLVLRVNNLGWVKEGDTLRVGPLDEWSRRKRVRTDTTINLPRQTWGSATIASRGDAETPTVVLLVESVDEPPQLVAERDGLVHAVRVVSVRPSPEDIKNAVGGVAVFRARVTSDGELLDAKVLSSPSPGYAERLVAALADWRLQTVLDEEGRKQEAIGGFGVRLLPQRVLASIGSVDHIGVEVTGNPVPEEEELYEIRAVITDLDTGSVVSKPRITARKGDEAAVRTGFVAPSGELATLEMRFLISEDGKAIRYSWTLTSNGKVMSSHKAELNL
jgi:hypothetical protein